MFDNQNSLTSHITNPYSTAYIYFYINSLYPQIHSTVKNGEWNIFNSNFLLQYASNLNEHPATLTETEASKKVSNTAGEGVEFYLSTSLK